MSLPSPRLVAALALLAVVFFAASSDAEEFVLFEDGSRSLVAVEVERNANLGGYLVLSLSSDSPELTTELRARRVERRDRRAVLGPAVVLSDTNRILSPPRLSFSSRQGVYLLVFVEIERGRSSGPIGRVLRADGEPLTAPFHISPDDGCRMGQLYGVAYSSLTNRWLVAWSSSGTAGRCRRVRARFVSASGVPGHEVRIAREGSNVGGGDLAYSPDLSEFLVVWSERLSDSIFGRRIRERDSRNGGRLAIANSRDDCLGSPKVAAGSLPERWLVAWRDRCADEPISFLRSRLLEANDRMRRATTFRAAVAVFPDDLAFDEASGRFLAVWDEPKPRTTSAERAVYSRIFRRSGRALGPARRISRRNAEGRQQFPRVSCSPSRPECLVVWLSSFAGAVGDFAQLRK